MAQYDTLTSTSPASSSICAPVAPGAHDDIEWLSTLGHEYINLVGPYRLVLAEPVRRGAYPRLREELVAVRAPTLSAFYTDPP